MSIDAFSGPLLVYGDSGLRDASGNPLPGTALGSNPNLGPSGVLFGWALIDPRDNYQPGMDPQASTNQASAWMACGPIPVVDQVPSALSASNIAAAQAATAGTALTLVSSSGSGITAGVSITNASTGATVTVLAIDTAAGTIGYGPYPALNIYDITKQIARNVRITSVGNDSGGTFTVAGYDIYGYPMTEQITGANAGVAAGKKAFKYIASVTPAGTLSGANVSVGTGDVYGFPLAVLNWAYVDVYWNGALITSSTGFTAADTTSPATKTTGDVRGTYATQSASDGSKRLQIFITPNPAKLATTDLVGVAQV